MTDSGTLLYVGDRYRRANGSLNKTNTSWATGAVTTRAAANAADLLGYTTFPVGLEQFRDVVWEQNGYDLDVETYRTNRAGGSPMTPNAASSATAGFAAQVIPTGTYLVPLVPAADKFKGFSMGPGYWGKSFFMWPPDPRWGDGSAAAPDPNNPSTAAGNGAKDANGRWIADWRRRFFLDRNGNPFDPQGDNNSATTGAGNLEGINEVLLNAAGGLTVANSTTNWRINYTAVLKWLKTGPQTLPTNLRAGRVLYYSSIPDDVNTTVGTTEQKLDKIFWKKYIDYVIGFSFTSSGFLYGNGDSWASSTRSIFNGDFVSWNGPAGANWPSSRPYMRYTDSPNRPRLHIWFGPLSIMDFIGYANNSGNWLPGTCHEAQCWQLKAGVNSVIDDVRNNRPNDYIGMVMFSATVSGGSNPIGHNGPRVEIGQNYNALKNGLFYPRSLLTAINGGDMTTEIRPYNVSFGAAYGTDEIPNANGSTDPNTGLAYAFNVLSPSVLTPATPSSANPPGYGTLKGRRGAGKVVILETDGVPNTYSGVSSGTTTMNPTLAGFDTYYPRAAWSSDNAATAALSQSEAVKVARQIVKPMATLGQAR